MEIFLNIDQGGTSMENLTQLEPRAKKAQEGKGLRVKGQTSTPSETNRQN